MVVPASASADRTLSVALHGVLLQRAALEPTYARIAEFFATPPADDPLTPPTPTAPTAAVDEAPGRYFWRLYAHLRESAMQHAPPPAAAVAPPPSSTPPVETALRPHALLLLPSLHVSSNALRHSPLSVVTLVVHSAELLVGRSPPPPLSSSHTPPPPPQQHHGRSPAAEDDNNNDPPALALLQEAARSGGFVEVAALSRLCVVWRWLSAQVTQHADADAAAAPPWQVRTSNDELRLRTRADSARAFVQLLNDLTDPGPPPTAAATPAADAAASASAAPLPAALAAPMLGASGARDASRDALRHALRDASSSGGRHNGAACVAAARPPPRRHPAKGGGDTAARRRRRASARAARAAAWRVARRHRGPCRQRAGLARRRAPRLPRARAAPRRRAAGEPLDV